MVKCFLHDGHENTNFSINIYIKQDLKEIAKMNVNRVSDTKHTYKHYITRKRNWLRTMVLRHF